MESEKVYRGFIVTFYQKKNCAGKFLKNLVE